MAASGAEQVIALALALGEERDRLDEIQTAREHREVRGAVHVPDGLHESLGSFLRQVVADSAAERAVRVLAGEFGRIDAWIDMRRPVGVALERDRGHANRRA